MAPLQRRPMSSTAWWKRGQNRDGSSAFFALTGAFLFADINCTLPLIAYLTLVANNFIIRYELTISRLAIKGKGGPDYAGFATGGSRARSGSEAQGQESAARSWKSSDQLDPWKGRLMVTAKQIKIIKRTERIDSREVGVDNRRTSVRNHLEETKRDAVTIVTGWIRELRRKKAQEAAHGFQGLFGNAGWQLKSLGLLFTTKN
jgi:hypothetical protein